MIKNFNDNIEAVARSNRSILQVAFVVIALSFSSAVFAADKNCSGALEESELSHDAEQDHSVVEEFQLAADPSLPQIAFASLTNSDCVRCMCTRRQTPRTTRVGATCLRARQNAAAAARLLAVCPANTEGHCGPTTHSVEPCQPLATGGFSATATAIYQCEVCREVCPPLQS